MDQLKSALYAAGFYSTVQFESLELVSAADSAQQVAQAYCLGTPWRHEIERCAPGRLTAVQADVTDELIGEYGTGPLSAPMQAWVIRVECED
ncbi:hypothetical protein NQT62_12475 [Limnobacter humi]|uniref:Uncharacterized protein n=1 Tax=Limnobacter humi TaxID=1778671 RepID=A0ABT1WIA3_9BURK|nr:hypothetical protein [Limnobacter humi]MCQ8897250.1 hypothetical protein [Limnobacter humi]